MHIFKGSEDEEEEAYNEASKEFVKEVERLTDEDIAPFAKISMCWCIFLKVIGASPPYSPSKLIIILLFFSNDGDALPSNAIMGSVLTGSDEIVVESEDEEEEAYNDLWQILC
jgi:hypothetical protein